ncbi:MAG: AAA family ATPase [Synergistaceae bacterium]|nr:AAA family ATPase [Synergistota bacterium]NLM70737.1 AAA family ATPase [Synergistaceae bacterium]
MRISEFFVRNYGIFSGAGAGLSEGLTVFHGDNESGKTTLMNFFRRVLFPRERYARKKGNVYEPVGGGRHAGTARIVMEDGREYVLTLDGKNNTISPAGEGEALPLPPDFFSISKDVYESVFAIGLWDMQSMELLNRSDIAARFFAAGSGLGSASLPGLLSSLEARANELYRPGASRSASAVNRLLASMRETDDQVRGLRDRSGSWREKREAMDEAERSAAARREELSGMLKRASFLELLEKGLAPRAALGDIERRLAESGDLPPFPEGGLDRLERLKDEKRRLDSAKTRLESDIRAKEEEAGELLSDPLLLCFEKEPEIRLLEQEVERLRTALARKNRLERELPPSRDNFLRNIADLCPWWNEEHLNSSDVSADAVAFARRTADRKETLERKKGEGEKSLGQWNRLREDRRAEAASLEREMGVVEKRAKRAAERWDLITRLRSAFNELRAQEDELGSMEEVRSALQAEKDRALEQKPLRPGLLVGMISGFLLLVGIGAALQAFLTAEYLWAFGSAALFTASLLALLAHRDLSKKYSAGLKQWERRLEDLGSRLEENELMIESRMEGLERLKTRRDELCLDLGIEAPRSESAMGRIVEEGEEDRGSQERFTLLGERNRQMTAVLARMDADGVAMEEELSKTERELDELNEEWRKWLEERKFDEKLGPRDLEGIVPRILQLRSEGAMLSSREAEAGELNEYVSEVADKIRTLSEQLAGSFDSIGEPAPSAASPEAIRAFSSLLRRASETRSAAESLGREAENLRRSLDEIKEEFDGAARKLGELFAAASTPDEEAFVALAEEWRKREALLAGRTQERKVLLGLFGSEEALGSAEEEYLFRRPEEIRSQAEEIRERINRLRSEVDELVDSRGRLASELERMGTDERQSELLFARKGMERKIEAHLEEWLSCVLARHFLEVSKARHERERQPEVIRAAGEYLSLMTDDRYLLLSEGSEKGLSVVLEEKDQARGRKDEMMWSSGLADQVYLSMRLALASLWGRNSEPLPLILDDLMVRFDEGRQRGAARAICKAAKDNQVLLFTCHKGTLDILADAAADDDAPSFIRVEEADFVPVRREGDSSGA